MKRVLFLYLLIYCCNSVYAQQTGVTFKSSDPALQTAFVRAKEMALSYKGKPADPVGPWYESALPPRSAFCMRDVAHQSIGGEILGLQKENKNMFRHFAKGISASKDWCSFWEMNHLGNPAPEDYRNDKAFWYNLNANFDLITASWKLYLWTGDEEYIKGAEFANFHEKSVTKFIDSWVLQADSLLTRPTHPNAPVPFNVKDAFNRCRGLPSYSEGVPNIKMGVDLVAALYSGLTSYANMLDLKGESKKAKLYREKAATYQKNIDALWWNDTASRYNTFYSDDHKFGLDEGETFLLWFDALKAGERKDKTIQHLLSNNWNVENLSYFPLIMYQNGHADKAYDYMLHLTDPSTKRREYPEVSFGVVKGFTEGLMGMEADARLNRISTLYRGKSGSNSELKDVPVLNTLVTIKHDGNKKSILTNNGAKKILWQAKFINDQGKLVVKKAVWLQPKASKELSCI
ncbi:trehalase family glycosidase [Pedobacter gandavensis]|uniref:Alpha-L-rhamnosidase six-hairpin glycosidase domain-containing protein n=1 Tax=Pedobacter gandavensis TaxID=2679963 RepID=A0ABR6EQP4_9SPHI|nr:trehalase family glycosidase [Pedobacter gandavensis]MBB2147578.1 hypothetical protein [Pedobacter gandavensis]